MRPVWAEVSEKMSMLSPGQGGTAPPRPGWLWRRMLPIANSSVHFPQTAESFLLSTSALVMITVLYLVRKSN